MQGLPELKVGLSSFGRLSGPTRSQAIATDGVSVSSATGEACLVSKRVALARGAQSETRTDGGSDFEGRGLEPGGRRPDLELGRRLAKIGNVAVIRRAYTGKHRHACPAALDAG